jgi:D-alanyl-D-alanine dipeptidase
MKTCKIIFLIIKMVLLAGCAAYEPEIPIPKAELVQSSREMLFQIPAPAIVSPSPSPTLPPISAVTPSPTPASTPSPTPAPKTLDDVFEYHGLVDIAELDPRIVLDIRYATVDNFTHVQQYPFPLALMQKEVAAMFMKAQDIAEKDGYRLRIYDSYRPLSIQQSLFDSTPPELSLFVARPSKNEKHSMGLAIDCGLSDMDGAEIEMPSGFDEFNPSAYIDFKGSDDEKLASRDYLISLMTSQGFTVYSKEWWHYNAPNANSLSAMDISFEEFCAKREESKVT